VTSLSRTSILRAEGASGAPALVTAEVPNCSKADDTACSDMSMVTTYFLLRQELAVLQRVDPSGRQQPGQGQKLLDAYLRRRASPASTSP